MNRRIQIVVAAGLLAAWQDAKLSSPEVPDVIKAPKDEQVVLVGHATGVQIYACKAGVDKKLAWVLTGPEAELTDASGNKIIHHSAGPTWRHVDGSEVTGKKVAEADAPKSDAIPWLLLTAKSHAGKGTLSSVTTIQRIHTQGGLVPAANLCEVDGRESRSAYSADYYFYSSAP